MKNFFRWIIENKTWIFDGIGVSLLAFFIGFFLNRKKDGKITNISQKGGKHSKNIQNNYFGNIEGEEYENRTKRR